MKVETRPGVRRRVQLGVGRVRRRGEHEGRGDVVVRVPLGPYVRLYAYVARGPVGVGDRVEVHARVQGRVVVNVAALGRGDYMGPLKRAKVVR
jgi:hypothetical protein